MRKILVVEDNEMNRDMLCRRLLRNGFSVLTAADGAQGINVARTEMPDVIIMDLSLPLIDGWEACRQLKADQSTSIIPIIALMTFLPRAWTRPELVIVVAGLAHACILLLVLAGLHWKSTKAIAATLVLTLIASISGVASMVVTMVGGRAYWQHTERLSNAFRWSGELAYLLIPLAVGLAVSIPWREARGKAALALSGLAAGAVAAGMAVWSETVGRDLPDLVYGAFRLDFLPERHFILYAIPLGIGAAVTVAAVLSRDPIRRQLGAALLLMLSAGYAPRTPSSLLLTVLAVALMARAAIAAARTR